VQINSITNKTPDKKAEVLVTGVPIYANGKKLAKRDVIFHCEKNGFQVNFKGAEGNLKKPTFWCGNELFADTFGPDWLVLKKQIVAAVKDFFYFSIEKKSVKQVVEEEKKDLTVFRRGLKE